MAQCGGITVHELNKLELELCYRLNWTLMPSAAQLHRFRGALDDEASPYWNIWSNVPKLAACDDAVLPCKSKRKEASSNKSSMPHAKSFQDQMGRLFFGVGHAPQHTPAEGEAQVQPRESNRPPAEVKMAPPSPGSPRSVFRRIFSEQVFGFVAS